MRRRSRWLMGISCHKRSAGSQIHRDADASAIMPCVKLRILMGWLVGYVLMLTGHCRTQVEDNPGPWAAANVVEKERGTSRDFAVSDNGTRTDVRAVRNTQLPGTEHMLSRHFPGAYPNQTAACFNLHEADPHSPRSAMAFSTSTNEGVSGHSPPRPPSPLVPTSLGDMDQDPLSTTEILDTCGLEVDNSRSGKCHLDHLSHSLSDSSFLQTLDHLLLAAVQQERRLSHGATRSATLRNALAPSVAGCAAKEMSRLGTRTRRSTDRPDKDLEPLVCSTRAARCAYTQSSVSRKRLRSRSLRPAAADCDHNHPSCFSVAHKKRKHYGSQPRLSGKGSLRRSVANPPVLGLSGAFNLCYAKGPGSLRRAESLRTEFPNGAAEEVVVLNVVSIRPGSSPVPRAQQIGRAHV